MDHNESWRIKLSLGIATAVLVLSGCSSDGGSDANPTPESQELDSPPDTLAFVEEPTEEDSDGVAVADVFTNGGADGELAQCYADAYEAVGVSDVSSFSELAQAQEDNDMSAAMAECVELVNGG